MNKWKSEVIADRHIYKVSESTPQQYFEGVNILSVPGKPKLS
jgi:hypothetical protein